MQIWKFPLHLTDRQVVSMPSGAKILSAQAQHGKVTLWAMCDQSREERQLRTLLIIGTGHPVPDDCCEFIGTVQFEGGSLVFHVFESA